MKQDGDDKTVDFLGEPKRGRGRPKGLVPPKTGAERQKALRDRSLASGRGFITVSLPLEMIDALDAFIKFKDTNKDAVIEKLVRQQLMRKR